MILSRQLISWRHHLGLTQTDFAKKAGITRAYLSRLEMGQVDPSLSTLTRLAGALRISVGVLLEQAPQEKRISHNELDQIARAVYHPGAKENRGLPYAQALARAYEDRRIALGLRRSRTKRKVAAKSSSASGKFALRRVRAILGEETWNLLLTRIEKHAAAQVKA